MSSNELLSKIFESFSLQNKTDTPTGRDPLQILNEETQKELETIENQRDDLLQRISRLSDTSTSIQSLSDHPRVQCRLKMSKFITVDALLNTSEYKLKYNDYSVMSSLKMTTDYVQKSIDSMQEEIETLNVHITRIKDQQLLAQGLMRGKPKEIIHADNSTLTTYENGLVDIVEMDSEPIAPVERKAKFKTKAERDAYLRNVVKHKSEEDQN